MLWTTAVLSASKISSDPSLVFRAIDREIIETDPVGDAGQRGRMAARETDVEGAHEGFFFETLGGARRHSRVEIPDVPAIGDRHVAGVRPAIDEDDPVLAKQTVLIGVIDKARDEEFLFLPLVEIALERGAIVELRKA